MEISRKSNYFPPARIETKFADWKKMERLEEEEGGRENTAELSSVTVVPTGFLFLAVWEGSKRARILSWSPHKNVPFSEGRRQARPASIASEASCVRGGSLRAAADTIRLSLGSSGPQWADILTAVAAKGAAFSPSVAELAGTVRGWSDTRTSDPPNIGITPANSERERERRR